MPSSSRHGWLVVTILVVATSHAHAQSAKGFALDRFYPSAPGGGWLVMDSLDMDGELGGAMAMSVGYARNPLRVGAGTGQLAVVSSESLVDIGVAVTHRWWRVYVDLATPLVIKGQGGVVGGDTFAAPNVDIGSNPDTLTDARLGFDARLVGGATSRFRVGAGGQLFVPNGKRTDYDSDETFRAMIRLLVAGDTTTYTYAGHFGVHVRPLDDSSVAGSPHGSELVFGIAGGAKLPVDPCTVVVVGPEVFGATALRSLFGSHGTALEALVSARVEGTARRGLQLRFKVGAGVGIEPQFGAPEWRIVVGVEAFNRSLQRTESRSDR